MCRWTDFIFESIDLDDKLIHSENIVKTCFIIFLFILKLKFYSKIINFSYFYFIKLKILLY